MRLTVANRRVFRTSDRMEFVNYLKWPTTKKSYVREQSIGRAYKDKGRQPAASNRCT